MDHTIEISNHTAFSLKIFRTTEGRMLENVLARHEKYYQAAEPADTFLVTLALDSAFELTTFDAAAASVEVTEPMLKSPPRLKGEGFDDTDPSPFTTVLYTPFINAELVRIAEDGNGDEHTISKVGEKGGQFHGVVDRSLYKVRALKSIDPHQTVLSWIVTGLPTEGDDGKTTVYNPYAKIDPQYPDTSFRADGHLLFNRSWEIPAVISGLTDGAGNHTFDDPRFDRRLSNGGKAVQLGQDEVIAYEYQDFNRGQGSGRFWIVKGRCDDLSVLGKTRKAPHRDAASGARSFKMGPGTMAVFYRETGGKGSSQEVGGDCSAARFLVRSFVTKHIESAGDACIRVFNELGQHDSTDDTAYRTTLVLSAYQPVAALPAQHRKAAPLAPGRPEHVFLEASRDGTQVEVDGQTLTLNPYPRTTRVPVNPAGRVVIVQRPQSGDKELRRPELFVYTDKMSSDLRVRVDPNTPAHRRLAAMKIDHGKMSGKTLDIKKHRKDLGIDKRVKDGELHKVVGVVQSLNQAVVQSCSHDTAGTQAKVYVDGSQMPADHHDFVVRFDHQDAPVRCDASPGSYSKHYGEQPHVKPLEDLGADSFVDDLIGDATSFAVTVGHAVEDAVEAAVHFVVVTAEGAFHFIADTAEKVGEVLSKVFEVIKLAIEKLIEFIRFLIELLLNGLHPTCQVLHNTVCDAVNDFETVVKKVKPDDVKSAIDSFYTDYIRGALGGGSDSSKRVLATGSDSHAGLEKFEWILGLLTRANQGANPFTEDPPKEGFLQKVETHLVEDLEKVADGEWQTLTSYLSQQQSGQEAIKQAVVRVADGVEDAVSFVAGEAVAEFQNGISAVLDNVKKPVEIQPKPVSDALDWIVNGLTGMDFSPLGISSTLYGVPFTLMWGFATGHLPYKKGDTNKSLYPGHMLSAGQSDDDAVQLNMLGILTDIASAVASPLTIANASKISKGEPPSSLAKSGLQVFAGVKLMGSVFSVVLFRRSWGGDKIFQNVLVFAGLVRGIWGFIAGPMFNFKNLPKINCAIDTILGLAKMICGLVLLIKKWGPADTRPIKAQILLMEGLGLAAECVAFTKNPDIEIVGIAVAAGAPAGAMVDRIGLWAGGGL